RRCGIGHAAAFTAARASGLLSRGSRVRVAAGAPFWPDFRDSVLAGARAPTALQPLWRPGPGALAAVKAAACPIPHRRTATVCLLAGLCAAARRPGPVPGRVPVVEPATIGATFLSIRTAILFHSGWNEVPVHSSAQEIDALKANQFATAAN